MKRRYYLIDTENVGNRWIELMEHLKEDDILVVFYTMNHSKQLEEIFLQQRFNKKIRWVECLAGNNALDYQLTGVLSYLIATHGEAGYYIYSNDKDYREVIEFWKQRNIDVYRVGCHTEKEKQGGKGKKPGNHPNEKELPVENSQNLPEDEIAEEQNGTDMLYMDSEEQIVIEIAKSVPLSNLGGWYSALVSVLGEEAGRRQYQEIKENQERRDELSVHIHENVHERNVRLVALLLRHNQMDDTLAKEAYDIIKAHKKNQNAIKKGFEKHFGNKNHAALRYYKVVRPVLPIFKGK